MSSAQRDPLLEEIGAAGADFLKCEPLTPRPLSHLRGRGGDRQETAFAEAALVFLPSPPEVGEGPGVRGETHRAARFSDRTSLSLSGFSTAGYRKSPQRSR